MKTFLVQLADAKWTNQAMHFACSLARAEADSQVILLHLINVPHPSYLGTEFGLFAPTASESRIMQQAGETAEDYGIAFSVQPMELCNGQLDAIAQAAEILNAAIIFTQPIKHKIPLLSDMQWRNFEAGLHRDSRQVYTLTDKAEKAENSVFAPMLKVQSGGHS